jgi:hypothetical protein
VAIPEGRVVALVGPNGAGKTTLLHLAVGLLAPSAGEVRVLGAPPANRSEVLARVGLLAQDKPLYSGFRVDEMLRFGARLNPGWDQAVADRWLERFELPPDRRVGQLSGGRRTQLALALTLAKRPRLLLLDEPMADWTRWSATTSPPADGSGGRGRARRRRRGPGLAGARGPAGGLAGVRRPGLGVRRRVCAGLPRPAARPRRRRGGRLRLRAVPLGCWWAAHRVGTVLGLAAAAQAVAGCGNGLEVVATDTLVQRSVDRSHRGRVFGVVSAATLLGGAIARGLGGVLLDLTSAGATFVIGGVGVLPVTLIAVVLLRGAGRRLTPR